MGGAHNDIGGFGEDSHLGHIAERSSIPTVHDRSRYFKADRSSIPDLYDLYDLVQVAGWEPYDLHDLLAHVSWVGSALYMQILLNLSQRQVTGTR